MQEEVESRSLTLAINTAKLTGRTLKNAIAKLLAYRKNKKAAKAYVHPQGKQSVKKLIGQNQGVSSIELADGSIRDFEHVARKYGVDFAIKKDKSADKPRYLVFFKARDADALTAALKEYAGKKERRPSVLKKLRDLTAQAAKAEPAKERRKELVREPTPEQRYRQEESRCYKVLSDYFHHLRTWKQQYAPKQPEDEWHPLFVEALQRESHIEYLLDVLLYGTAEEKKALVAEQRKEVMNLEQRFAEHSDEHDRGGSQGESGLDR